MATKTQGEWGLRIVFVLICCAVLFFKLLPLRLEARSLAGPDIILMVMFAWTLRRPDSVPVLLCAIILLLSDFLLMRPPGLWALLVLLATEWLRVRDKHLRNATFWAEWLNVSVALAGISLIYSFALTLMFEISDAYFLSVMQFSLTVLLYPAVVFVSRIVFAVRRPPAGEHNQQGRTI